MSTVYLAVRDDDALREFANRLRTMLKSLMPMEQTTRALNPRLLALSSQATALLVGFADAVEAEQAPGRSLAHVTGYASKAVEQAARIAGVLTAWADLNAAEVSGPAMHNGITLAQFYLSEAVRLADAATVSAEVAKAEALRHWLLEAWEHPEVMVRDVLQLGPNALRESPKARAALQLLEKHGWLVPLPAGTVVRGASRKEVWRIVRATHVV
ncbi:MAG: DUF3987 domain-containing protein [Rhodospirillales bacterium]|nr:DUF3987 domain-containing protein [Rhodospirillales bacterium]